MAATIYFTGQQGQPSTRQGFTEETNDGCDLEFEKTVLSLSVNPYQEMFSALRCAVEMRWDSWAMRSIRRAIYSTCAKHNSTVRPYLQI
jgi:hypothetical protein